MSSRPNPRSANGHRRRKALARIRVRDDPCWICRLPIDPSLPARHPESLEADEIVPVSKGGSPYDIDNIARAHRCCNNWRRTKPAWLVDMVRLAVAETFGSVAGPTQFVEAAKSVEKRGTCRLPQKGGSNTTEW